MWGIIPAVGSRSQPLAFSKELLPVGSRFENGTEQQRAVSEYLVERMIRAGADNLCFVVPPGKMDILEYFGGNIGRAHVCYTIQHRPAGFCDAIFRALPLIHPRRNVVVGLPDTVWFPEDGLCTLPDDELAFLLFPVSRPELFESVITDAKGRVLRIDVRQPTPVSHWIWGGFKMPEPVMRELFEIWSEPGRRDEYFGTLVNAYLERGGRATAVYAGEAYVDTGALNGYREAIRLLGLGPHNFLRADAAVLPEVARSAAANKL
jgi:glucose-1-phosphate thymidylyltransferase